MDRTTSSTQEFATSIWNINKRHENPQNTSPPGFHVVRPTTETSKIDDKTQKLFRSGVGMLLYLVKHSRPDLSNCTGELSKVMDGATTIQWNELLRVIKYAIDTKKQVYKWT